MECRLSILTKLAGNACVKLWYVCSHLSGGFHCYSVNSVGTATLATEH